MKHFTFFVVVFLLGAAFGRYSAENDFTKPLKREASLNFDILKQGERLKSESKNQLSGGKKLALTELTKYPKDFSKDKEERFVRKEKDRRNYEMQELYSQLVRSISNKDIEEQNRIFDEMLLIDPKHEVVFKAKASFLQDDADWVGAHEVLKECVEEIPESLHCHKRLANIRSSSIDDKIFHGFECLKLQKNDLVCTVDLAMALRIRGDYQTAINLFEKALKQDSTSDGFSRKYILLQYGITLEEADKEIEAIEMLSKACDLNSKAACLKLNRI